MEINEHNYEAFLLDYIEGRLSVQKQQELLAFIALNVQLGIDLNDLAITPLQPSAGNTINWDRLRKTAELSDAPDAPEAASEELASQDFLFFKIAEGIASPQEQEEAQKIAARGKADAAQLRQWKKTRLTPPEVPTVENDRLYRFSSLESEVSLFNFDQFLMAYADGLLSATQTAKLKAFCNGDPSKEKELSIASHLKLKPAEGIFYPEKNKLYHREKSFGWLKIAAAIVVLIAGAWMFQMWNEAPKDFISETKPEPTTETSIPATEAQEAKPSSTIPEEDQNPVPETPEHNLPATVVPNTTTAEPAGLLAQDEREIPDEYVKIEPLKTCHPITLKIADSTPRLALAPAKSVETIERPLLANANKPQPNTSNVQTLGELVQKEIRSRLGMPDDSAEQPLAKAVLQSVQSKAEEAFNADVALASGDAEATGFKVRIGNFSLTHHSGK